ncbi:hypothetical protein BY458DRAFT_406134, partial [Sporodiniella umbellata]
MAPDPTCQNCNEQFIEELQSDDDPRTFLSGQETNSTSLPPRSFFTTEGEGGNSHFFSLNPTQRADMGDDVFQFFGPTTRSTEDTTE